MNLILDKRTLQRITVDFKLKFATKHGFHLGIQIHFKQINCNFTEKRSVTNNNSRRKHPTLNLELAR